jgi:hypothetical protein
MRPGMSAVVNVNTKPGAVATLTPKAQTATN